MRRSRFKLSCIFFFAGILVATAQQRLVLPGDHPDPSVAKIGDTYWASATTSNWFPAFPLLKSKDLLHWELKGYVFDKMPDWADYYFWAPELSYDHGKVYVYYAAHKKGGNLCVAAAVADRPEGPYKDLGPLVCQEDGSIDAFPIRDENGKLYLVWKEDANSVNKPTPIWAQEMKEDRTGLIGEKKELFRNNVQWEGNLVEGVSMIKHGGYYYAFYAAAGCCGIACTYSIGVARSKSILGPWEKYDHNPVMVNNEDWVCPGHGTPVERNGKYYFLYHSYDKKTNAFTGRQGILNEFRFTGDNWVEFIKKRDTTRNTTAITKRDEFNGQKLSLQWQWGVFEHVKYQLKNGALELSALPEACAFLGQKILSGNYEATAVLLTKKSDASGGIANIGDEKNMVSLLYSGGNMEIVELKEGKENTLYSKKIRAENKLFLRIQVKDAKNLSFLYSTDGKKFTLINDQPIDGSFLPPWDRAVRTGLVSKGNTGQKAVFDSYEMISK